MSAGLPKLCASAVGLSLVTTFLTVANAQIAPYPQQPPPPAPARNAQDTAPVPPKGNLDDYTPFYNELYPYGTWIRTPRYGNVFQPFEAQAGWAPYSIGYWAFSAEGWVWKSPEPWSWAAYHFGNWAYVENTGWVWVPGRVWAPAWVSWRRAEYMGEICYGWAPLPPEAVVYGDGDETVIGEDLDSNVTISPGFYHFVPEIYLGQHDYRPYVYQNSRNGELIAHSSNITHIVIKKPDESPYLKYDRVKSGGPQIDSVKSSRPIDEVTLTLSRKNPGRVDATEVPAGTVPRPIEKEAPSAPREPTHLVTQDRSPEGNGSQNFNSREMPPVVNDNPPHREHENSSTVVEQQTSTQVTKQQPATPRPEPEKPAPTAVAQQRPRPTPPERTNTPPEQSKEAHKAKGRATPEPSPSSTH